MSYRTAQRGLKFQSYHQLKLRIIRYVYLALVIRLATCFGLVYSLDWKFGFVNWLVDSWIYVINKLRQLNQRPKVQDVHRHSTNALHTQQGSAKVPRASILTVLTTCRTSSIFLLKALMSSRLALKFSLVWKWNTMTGSDGCESKSQCQWKLPLITLIHSRKILL